jgi:predicted ester cyclase
VTDHAAHRALIGPLRKAMRDGVGVADALGSILADDAVVHMCAPFGDMTGGEYFTRVYAPLMAALPDVERRDWIVMAGADDHGNDWVGCGGHYMGSFDAPFLDIPPTGRLVHMRFHEYYRIADGQIVEIQAIWDIPELMMQAGVWPMVPSLGREFCVPGPASCDGLGSHDQALSETSKQHIIDMLTALTRHPREPVEAMELPRFWSSQMNWYGPAGIGTARGIQGFREHHQIPFLAAMPDRGQADDDLTFHFFGDGNYAAVTGWPDMVQSITHCGWLGIAPAGQKVSMRSLDFWRLEDGKIRENWVLLDMIDIYAQLGVDVFARMRQMP